MMPFTAEAREFLTKHFSDEELTTLCFDHFPEVHNNFNAGLTTGQKIQQLLDYCRRQESLPELYAHLRRERPAQWTRLLNQLRESGPGVIEPPVAEEARRPFKRGLNPFDVEDADIFLGRIEASKKLFERIRNDRLVVVMGWSGSGKSSLVRAGVIPRLQAAHYPWVYAQVRELISQDVLRAVNDELTYNGVKAIESLDRLPEAVLALQGEESPAFHPLVLIVDQFDQALSSVHPTDDRARFLKSIVFLLQAARPLVKVVIVARADWQFLLEQAIREFDLNLSSLIFPVDYLTREEARRALIGPMDQAALHYDTEVVNDILDRLLVHDSESVGGEQRIQPVHLQLVADSLTSLAEESGDASETLSATIYQRSGGIESILRNYLARSVREREAVWHLLARFITPDGKSRSLRRSELEAIRSIQALEEAQDLIGKGLLQAYEGPDQEARYRLSHDYLIGAINSHLTANPDQHGWKLADDWLTEAVTEAQAAAVWQIARRQYEAADGQRLPANQEAGINEELLLERNRYFHIYQYRNYLELRDEAARSILIRSALQHGHAGLAYWLSTEPAHREQELRTVASSLLTNNMNSQVAARLAVAGSLHLQGEDAKPLEAPDLARLHTLLKPALETAGGRLPAAQALWCIRSAIPPAERRRAGRIVLGNWLTRHQRAIGLYALSLVLVLAAVFGVLFIQNRLRGTWRMVDSLKGGQNLVVWADPNNPGSVYTLSFGDPGSREGASFYVWQGDYWELRAHDFTKGWPTSITATPNGIFIALYGVGIQRSLDGGRNWAMINRGLPSRGLTAIVADPFETKVLYLGTNDFRGVLKSTDNGESWTHYDYRGEIFGAQITTLAYTNADGGMLIAGTGDGRILGHCRDSNEWLLLSNLGKGPISRLVVAAGDQNFVYGGTARGIVLRSNDAGRNWRSLGQIDNQFYLNALAVDATDSKWLLASTYGNEGNTVWESRDAGEIWQPTGSHGLPRSTLYALTAVGRSPRYLFGGSGDGLFVSLDNATTWDNEALETPIAAIRGIAIGDNATKPVYIYRGGSIYTNPSGDLKNWIHARGLEAEGVRTLVVDPEDPNVAYAGVMILGQWSVYKTENGGQDWYVTTAPAMESIIPDTTALVLVKNPQTGAKVLFAGTIGCGLLQSPDGGHSWDTFGRTRCDQLTDGDMPADIFMLAVDGTNLNVVYAGAGQQLSRSEDGGVTWHESDLVVSSPLRTIASDALQADVVYAAAGLDGLWRSRDRGRTWTKIGAAVFDKSEVSMIETVPDTAGHLIVGTTDGRVWTTEDSGETWTSRRENLTITSVNCIATSSALNGQILVGSSSEGIGVFIPGSIFGSQP